MNVLRSFLSNQFCLNPPLIVSIHFQTGVTGNMIILSVLYKGSSLVSDNLLTVGNLSSFLMYAAYVGISVSGLTSAYSELSKGKLLSVLNCKGTYLLIPDYPSAQGLLTLIC